jgi:hypothetical protein
MRTDAPPTVKQMWALAATLCEKTGEIFPRTRGEASDLLDKLKGGRAAGQAPSKAGDSKVLA